MAEQKKAVCKTARRAHSQQSETVCFPIKAYSKIYVY